MPRKSIEEFRPLPGKAAPFEGPCRWLIALDYDGTLRQAHGNPPVSEAFFELMRQWRPLGVRWGINTGRSLRYLCDDLLPCSPCLPDFICTFERFAYVAGEDGIVAPVREHNQPAHEANMKLRMEMAPHLHEWMERISRAHPQLRWEYAERDPLSVEARDADMMERIAPLLEPLVRQHEGVAMQRAGRFMRLSDARYNKGTALACVAAMWQLPPEQLCMAGDGHNDLDAFRTFPSAFRAAPCGAHPHVAAALRAMGGYVSPCEGVMELLQHWFSTVVERKGEQHG